MIKTRSPHYVITSFVSPLTGETCSEYTLNVYVWSGLKASVPATPAFSETKQNPTSSTGDDEVNIARLVSPFVTFTPQTSTTTANLNGVNQAWVQHEVIYVTDDPADDDVKQSITIDLMIKGYGGGMEGINPSTPTNKILLSGSEFDVQRDGSFTLPILADEVATTNATVLSFPDSQIDETFVISATTTSAELVRYIFVRTLLATTDEYIEITYNGVTTTFYIKDEHKYTPIDIVFQNKEGSQQIVTFFKKVVDSMEVTDEMFESDRGQPIDGNHQFVRFNVNSKSKFTVNSGFIQEELNETFTQLLVSEKVWSLDGSLLTPLNISKKSIEYKTRQNDRLINYEGDFDFAFNDINTI